VLLLVFLQPQHPPVNAHNGIIQVNACLAIQVPLDAQEYINDGAYKPYGIHPDVFNAREPYAANTGYNGNVFEQRGIAHTFHKLL
jgi:N-methylhydantoinase B/oxoprolinase/acetone carboxylase alpha subunit